MKISVLVDNNTWIDQYYLGEPALSYYIEIEDKYILFDTGYSDIFIKNAKKMTLDLHKIDTLVLSHGHNDHTNGLAYLYKEIHEKKIDIIAHPDVFNKKYLENEYIGSPYTLNEISQKANLILTKNPYFITEKLIYLGEIPRVHEFEACFPIGKQEVSGQLEDDYVKDDSALVYKSEQGLFIITGCSHSGICNIVEYAKKICKEDRVVGILGGFHLLKENDQLVKTIEYLKSCHIHQLYPCHCVSLKAKAKMIQQLNVEDVGVGLQLEVQ